MHISSIFCGGFLNNSVKANIGPQKGGHCENYFKFIVSTKLIGRKNIPRDEGIEDTFVKLENIVFCQWKAGLFSLLSTLVRSPTRSKISQLCLINYKCSHKCLI